MAEAGDAAGGVKTRAVFRSFMLRVIRAPGLDPGVDPRIQDETARG
jgi:hypothetical protein